VEYLGWAWIFFVNVPVGVASIALSFLLLEARSEPETSRRLDLLGATTVTVGLDTLVYGLTRAERAGLDPMTAATLALAAVLVAAFVLVERRAKDPLIPPSVFRSRDLMGSSLVAFANTATTSPVAVLAALYVQGVLLYPPSLAGLLGLPLSLSVVAGSFLGSRLLEKLGARRAMALGLLGICAASLLTAGISAGSGVAYVVSGAALAGLSLGCSAVASTARGTSAVGEGQRGLASGLLNSSAQVGTALGLAVLFAIAAAVSAAVAGGGEPSPEALVAGYRAAFCVGAVIAAAGALAAMLLIREKRGRL
jgi:MFS family permease